ncbi:MULTISPECIES: RNA-directed DNA polymerase [Myroides]|uniref:RNA-directed DNA polymerase n=1 Tax=Myroides TaxID=76831 RepID=UPI00117C0E94|nr:MULTISPECIES: RNA-directed DNA polymerase [Myroides]
MRDYSSYIEEISDIDLYEGLVGYGLFAEKIPDFLTSIEFLDFTNSMTFPINNKPKDFIRYSSMRNINILRPMAIPEPFAYANQAKYLANNWNKLQDYFFEKTKDNAFKISRIHLRKLENRSELFEMNYKNFSKDGDPEQDIVIKSKYVALADISNCFPSIYSHSISWALVGKSIAKSKSKPSDQSEWFNTIDFNTRNLKHGETNGVLIGPHSSNLISEILLVSVDNELSKQKFNYIRNIDDYTCYVNSYEEADRFFLCLSEELKKYELALNSKKSKIIPLPQASVKKWVTKLNHFNFTNTYQVNSVEAIRVKELKGFIDFAIELMLDEDSDVSILNYAIKIISNKHLDKNAKNYYIKQIHHLVLLYPYLVHILESKVFEPHDISKDIIKNMAHDLYLYGSKKKIYEACSYAIYWAIKYDFKLEIPTIKNDAIDSLDCIYLMIAYLYDKKHNKNAYLKEYKDLSKSLKTDDFDRYWLFIYETLPHTELSENFKALKKKKVTFIKNKFL